MLSPKEIKEQERFWKDKKVLITGASGFLGKHLVERLKKFGPKKILQPSSTKYDLREYSNCIKVSKGADIIIHLAAKVGGIGYNKKNPADLFYDNLMISINMTRAAHEMKTKKFVGVGTICSYPKFTPVPFKESSLWNGYPEETNAPYGLAKKMMLVYSQALNEQYGFNCVNLLPVNLYGPGDNFNPESSHVIPALIKRFIDARDSNKKEVVVWGTGKATREFIYVEDAALGILLASSRYNKPDATNLGSGYEISIKNLADKIKGYVGYKGKLVWDKSKPDGQPKRRLSISRAKKEFGFKASTNFDKGLKATIEWYEKNRFNE